MSKTKPKSFSSVSVMPYSLQRPHMYVTFANAHSAGV